MQEIKIELTKAPKEKPADQSKLGFGKIFTDHMYVMPYNKEQGWHDPKIVPYQPISLEPSAMVFHYGQEMFEGLKAYKTEDGRVCCSAPTKILPGPTTPTTVCASPKSPRTIFSTP